MKLLLYGKNATNIEPLARSLGFTIVNSNPDTVISYGGDGTLLASERLYPGIPKLPIRDSLVCKKCPDHGEKVLLEKLLEGKLKLKEYKKLETTILYQTFLALNDFVIRNAAPMHAIRFQTTATNKLLIGDGIVLSTPFGSTGYFKSITGETFKKGWGLAFNNITEKVPPVFLKDEDSVTFKLIRGDSTMSFDNNPDIFKVDEGSEIQFKLSDKVAKIYELESLRCPNCHVTRG
jgi:NAD+ kinase